MVIATLLAVCSTVGIVAADGSGPAEVLDGTDVVSLAEIPDTGLPSSVPGIYRSEQGGAEATLTVEATPRGFQVVRSLSEPGADAFVQVYSAEQKDGLLRSADDALIIRGAPDGLLVYEAAAEDGIVPPDYWTRYNRSD
jgi:hypothetical protein